MTEIIDPIQTEETLLEHTTAEVVESEATMESEEVAAEPQEKKIYNTREEILERMAEIASEATEQVKGEINYLKVLYYKLRQQEVDAELQKLLESDGDPLSYVTQTDELEPKLKELLQIQKDARASMVEARNKEYAENLEKKNAVLEQMDTIASNVDGIGQQYNTFQDLQKQFKEIGAVDPQYVNVLWSKYNQIGEKFYDALKINKELRDYDFKKNLEKKEALCEEAEKLTEAGDILSAFRRLQDMHEEWKGLGPVAKEIREEIWARFKAASTIINKRHLEHFESIKAQEAANEEGKNALCEKLEAIKTDAITTVKEWEEKTKEVIALQQDWRKLGFASKKVNTQIWERFRGLCDSFFMAKNEFYKAIQKEQAENLAKKTALCEKAEALKDSTDWRSTTDILIKLQQEWKEIGPVKAKISGAIWDRFRSACDTFFTAKEAAVGGEKAMEKENLKKKKDVLERMQTLIENIAEATPEKVRELMAEWKEIGHVPFKEKDKLSEAYQTKVDYFFANLDMKARAAGRLAKQKGNKAAQEGKQIVDNSRKGLIRQYDALCKELKTYENNLGFLSFSKIYHGQKPFMAEMQGKVDALKAQIQELVDKINETEE